MFINSNANSLRTGVGICLIALLLFTCAGVNAQEDFTRLKAQGISYFQRGEYEKAREFFIRAAKIQEEAEVYKYLSEIFRRQGDKEYADRLAEKARQLEENPSTPPPPRSGETVRDQSPPIIEIIAPSLTRGMYVTPSASSKTNVIGRATDASGVSEVTVRGMPARLDAEGNFSAEVGLKMGENRVLIAAVDTFGNKAEKEIVIVREMEAVAPPPGSPSSVSLLN